MNVNEVPIQNIKPKLMWVMPRETKGAEVINGPEYYKKAENTDILLISDESHLRSFYNRWLTVGESPAHAQRKQGSYFQSDFFENGLSRYETIKSQIYQTFAEGSLERTKNIDALDTTFGHYLENEAKLYALMLGSQQEGYQKIDSKVWKNAKDLVRNPIANHKHFNAEIFGENLKSTMRDFAKSFVNHMKTMDVATAWQTIIAESDKTPTKSINNISLNDFRIMTTSTSYSLLSNLEQDERVAAQKNQYRTLGDNENLSPFLRDIFSNSTAPILV